MNGYLLQLRKYSQLALKISQQFRPDLIWACSDAYHAIFGSWLASRVRAQCVIDLYDNFEAFPASRVPGVLPLFRRAIKAADGVTTFSRRLADHVARTYGRSNPISVIENGARPEIFYPRERTECRRHFGLPQDAKIIGTAGALDSSRGIEVLFEAFGQLSAESEDIHLALAGPRDQKQTIPAGPRIHDFSTLRHEEVSTFVNALDVAVVCYRHSAQGEYSFPQKAYEIIACQVPLVAAAVGSMNELLENYPDCLYEPQNSASLADTIRRQLQARRVIDMPTPSWADSAVRLETFFQSVRRS
jgi:Glycosyltransferase